MVRVVVLGGSGMLGSLVTDYLSRDPDLKVVSTVRSQTLAQQFSVRMPKVEWRILDVSNLDREVIQNAVEDVDWIINAIGMTKPYTNDGSAMEIERAIQINAMLPYVLGHAAAARGARVLQIATDCVYDGVKGNYVESDPHNPLDVYGKTKSLGEALLPNVHCLRCSIIGPEPKVFTFLLEWFRRQPANARISGYTNHQWNGVTTLQFARFCRGIILHALDLPHVHHVVPADTISKLNLLKCFAHEYRRTDVTISSIEAKTVIDRTLGTSNQNLNRQLWSLAGYSEPPSILQMVAELARFDYCLDGVSK
jgi:dTDP-4-dehydrorhamnose reductase